MITHEQSARLFLAVKGPTRGGQTLADKLQRLVLEQPRVATQIERLVDEFLERDGAR